MNVDGANVKQVTHSYNDEKKVAPTRDFSPVYKINALPTFSPDGRKIIFLRSGVLRERSMGGEMVSHWDVYEVELATGKERQLTDYRFYAISRPYYLPNDKGIIFSAVNGKGTFPAELNSRKNPSIYVDGKKVNQPYDSLVNEIFIIEENKKPYLAFKHDAFASKPVFLEMVILLLMDLMTVTPPSVYSNSRKRPPVFILHRFQRKKSYLFRCTRTRDGQVRNCYQIKGNHLICL